MARYPETLEELIEQYDDKLRTLVRNTGLGLVEDDVVQSVYLYFLEKDLLGKFDPERGVAFSTYFYGYARNLVLRQYRQLKKIFDHQHESEEVLDWVSVELDLDSAYLTDDELEYVLLKLFGLKMRGQRDLFRLFVDALQMLRDTGSLNQSALARRYGLSASSIKNQLLDLGAVFESWGFVVYDEEEGVHVWSTTELDRSRAGD